MRCVRPSRLPCADHDHRTGLLRSLPCRSCNGREGSAGSLLCNVQHPDIAPYLASRLRAGRLDVELPDRWSPAHTEAVRIQQCTVLAYVSDLPILPERSETTTDAALHAADLRRCSLPARDGCGQ